jgi:hypothetical protein
MNQAFDLSLINSRRVVQIVFMLEMSHLFSGAIVPKLEMKDKP